MLLHVISDGGLGRESSANARHVPGFVGFDVVYDATIFFFHDLGHAELFPSDGEIQSVSWIWPPLVG